MIEHLQTARQRAALGSHCVLTEVAKLTGVDVAELQAEPYIFAGVTVLSHKQESAIEKNVKSIKFISSDCISVAIDSQNFIVCADPWSRKINLDKQLLALTTRTRFNSWIELTEAKIENQDSKAKLRADQSENNSYSIAGDAIALLDAIISNAQTNNASDIHFESRETSMLVRFRVDGVLYRELHLDDLTLARQLVSRVKVLAELDIGETRIPQDGRFTHKSRVLSLDLRVSVMPGKYGEDAVLRLLEKSIVSLNHNHSNKGITLDTLGFVDTTREIIRQIANQPSGLLLVTGPTGSGKTTTLFSILSELDSDTEKIVTIEDPIEYKLSGALQVAVNDKKGLTFARGLRSALRHDPDKILVGEIRDAETAEIAVQSALTGHTVYSTIHANGPIDVIGRLVHFNLDLFSFANSVNGIVSQRLLRLLCDKCKRPETSENKASYFIATGCSYCRNTGHSGRQVVCEVLVMNSQLRDAIISRSSIETLETLIRAFSTCSLLDECKKLLAEGKVSRAEVRRILTLNHEQNLAL
jgi:general secretion pathway protein E